MSSPVGTAGSSHRTWPSTYSGVHETLLGGAHWSWRMSGAGERAEEGGRKGGREGGEGLH